MAQLKLHIEKNVRPRLSSFPIEVPSSPSTPTDYIRSSRNKSVQWADWEMKNVMEFPDLNQTVDDSCQTETEPYLKNGALPLIDTLVQTSAEISSIASRSSFSASMTTCTTAEESEDKQTALENLITHLEDTAALLREYIRPPDTYLTEESDTSYEQTVFLLKYLIVLVLFTQIVSILILTLFDHLTQSVTDKGYRMLTISCSVILQILNMMLVSFATVVLSRQMLQSKVEGKFMAQTYLATVITFAGLYFVIYRVQPSSWDFGSDKMENHVGITQFIKMLYLSVSAATLCGASNIQPRSWYVTLILCIQSLINFVYFASILAQTIGNYHSYTVQVRRTSSMSRPRAKS